MVELTDTAIRETDDLNSSRSRVMYALRRWPIFPMAVLVVLLVTGVFAPWIAPQDPNFTALRERNAPPFWMEGGDLNHILGADPLGRDLLSRVIYGARISLLVAVVSIGAGLLVGVSSGLVSGYFGGLIDEFIMRMADVSRAVPYILIALVVAIVFGRRIEVILGILAFATWPVFARQVRGEVLVLKETDYVAMAKVAGGSSARIIVRHIFPRRYKHRYGHRNVASRSVDTHRGDSQFSGRRHSASHPGMGSDDRRRSGLPPGGVVGVFLPRDGHRTDGSGPQLHGRLAARLPGPEAAATGVTGLAPVTNTRRRFVRSFRVEIGLILRSRFSADRRGVLPVVDGRLSTCSGAAT